MKKRIVLFGCSHTAFNFHKNFDEKKYEIINNAYNGNSNQKIIHDVYTYIDSDEYNIDDVLIIQYTYTNRLWWPNKLERNYLSFHSFDVENSPLYASHKYASEELLTFYQTYIKYFWNYDTAFTTHKMNIDFLKTYLESKNVKFIHWMYTDGGNTHEWNSGFNKFWKKYDANDIFSKLDLFKMPEYIDGIRRFNDEYRICEWAKNLGFVDETDHINENGNKLLAEEISKIIEKKFG